MEDVNKLYLNFSISESLSEKAFEAFPVLTSFITHWMALPVIITASGKTAAKQW